MSSSLNPAIILGGQPVQPQNALQTISQISQLKNAQQENQLRGIQMQGALQENQQRQLQLDQTKALNDAYMSAVNPDGSIDTGKLTDALSQGGHGSAIPSVLKGIQDYQKSTADTVEAKTKAATAQADHGGAIGSAVLAAGGDPHLAMSLVTSGLKSGTIDPNNAQQILSHMQQLMTADPTGEQAKQFALKAAKGLVDQSPAQQELALKKQTSDAAKLTAETKQKAEQREQSIADINKPKLAADADLATIKSLGQRLGANPLSYASTFNSLSDQDKANATRLGFTDPSTFKTARDAMNAANNAAALTKSAHERTEETQKNAELGQGQQRLGLEAQRNTIAAAQADPYGIMGINQHPMSANAGGTPSGVVPQGEDVLKNVPPALANRVRAIVEGRETALTGRYAASGPGAQLMNLVNDYDPKFSTQRAQIRKDFTTGADGRNIGNLNTAAVHLDQWADAVSAQHNGSFVPGNEIYNRFASTFGAGNPPAAGVVKTALAGELATALKGVATDQEISHINESLRNAASPEQVQKVKNEALHLLGAKLNTYQERYSQQIPGDKVYSPILPSAKAVFAKNGINATAGPSANGDTGSSAGQFSVQVPNGKPYHFKSQADADAFKQSAGIK